MIHAKGHIYVHETGLTPAVLSQDFITYSGGSSPFFYNVSAEVLHFHIFVFTTS